MQEAYCKIVAVRHCVR